MANPANSTAYVLSNGPFVGRVAVDVTEAKTLALADCGYVQNVKYDNAVITLPATATLGDWTIMAGGVKATSTPTGAVMDESMKLSVSPNSSDKIQGGVDGTATDDKDLILAKATMKVGNYVVINNCAQTDGPIVRAIAGTWSRES